MMAPRTARRRDGDFWPVRLASLFMRWRGIANIVWMGVAAVATGLVLAWRFSPRLDRLEGRATIIEIHETLIDQKNDSLWLGMRVLQRSACLDRTKSEQDLIGMICSVNLYKGAKP